jgi:hypothetical protein
MQASTLLPAQQAQTGDLLFTHVTASDAGHVKLIIAVSGGTAHTVQAPQQETEWKLSDAQLAGAVIGHVTAR